MSDEFQEGAKPLSTQPMTRGQQTAWIVGAIAVVGAGALWYSTRLPEGHAFKSCQGIILMDNRCKALAGAKMMMGLEPVAVDLVDSAEEDAINDMPAEEAMPPDPGLPNTEAEDETVSAEEMAEARAIFDGPENSNALADPELQMGSRQTIELNDMICAQTGQNCEAARMARRHHIERYGRF